MAPPSTGGPDSGATEDWGDVAGAFEAVERAPSSQDCLNLNVWTPDPGAAGLPVMVWIQGGMFELSSTAAYDGSRFARDGVVCVVINWRPGAEGFLYLADGTANLGLLDQVAALEWVRENIAAFGGDPDNVTVFGESAGAMSIGALLAMPRAEGLFQRAILQSGAAQHVTSAEDALRIAGYLADAMGVDATREDIAGAGVGRLLAAQAQLKADLLANPDPTRWGLPVVTTTMPWQPVIDGDVLPGHPLERIAAGSAAGVDVLVGTNVDDWRLWLRGQRRHRPDHRRDPDRTGRRVRLPVPGRLRPGPRDRAGRLPGPVPRRRAGRPARRRSRPTGGCASPPSGWPRPTPHPLERQHVHVRVRLALTRARRGPRPRGAVRLRHREHARPALRPAARPGPTPGAGPHHARRLGRVRHHRQPGLAPVRPRHQDHDAVRHHLTGGARPPGLGTDPVGRHPLMPAHGSDLKGGEGMAPTNARPGPRATQPRPPGTGLRPEPGAQRNANPCWTGWPEPAAASRSTPWSSST